MKLICKAGDILKKITQQFAHPDKHVDLVNDPAVTSVEMTFDTDDATRLTVEVPGQKPVTIVGKLFTVTFDEVRA